MSIPQQNAPQIKRLLLERRAELELAGIDAALERIEQGLYGACQACGTPIEPARLQAVPYAVLCAECASA